MSSHIGTPRGGISPALIDFQDQLPPSERWNQLAAQKAIIGQCRVCQGSMVADPTDDRVEGDAGIQWLEAHCLQCGKQIASPNGRIFRRSSAHAETPHGYLERRKARDTEGGDKG